LLVVGLLEDDDGVLEGGNGILDLAGLSKSEAKVGQGHGFAVALAGLTTNGKGILVRGDGLAKSVYSEVDFAVGGQSSPAVRPAAGACPRRAAG
jgi:hypothetical protein